MLTLPFHINLHTIPLDIHLFQKTLSERTANGSCRTEIARPKGTVVSYLVCKNNEFFAWR